MKKLFIIALAAVVAMTACTKVNPEEKKSDKISFTVANYMPQTKANTSLNSEGFENFACDAWQFPEVGTTTRYMDSVLVVYKTTEWSPNYDYFWPKTGYINFYSHAGTKAPAVTATAPDYKTVTMKYTNVTIEANDNFLVANPALHFGIDNFAADSIQIDQDHVSTPGKFNYIDDPETDDCEANYVYQAYSGTNFKGVPTLFNHMLAKVAVIVKLKTTTQSTSTQWTVTVLDEADPSTNKSNIKAYNNGSLTLTNDGNVNGPRIGKWSLPSATDKIGWVAGTSTETMSFKKAELVLTPKNAQSLETPIDTLLAVRTVMPQVTTGVDFNLAYKVSAKHVDPETGAVEETPFMEEILKVNKKLCGEEADKPATLAPTAWNMNQITLYTITIDPVGKKVTFDPAVVEWISVAGDLIELPEED